MKLPELLSPAGNMESLKAAVENGADAVYMGGRAFNARRNAANFSNEELKEAIAYAHARGVNAYIALNTLISDAEMRQAMEAAGQAYEAGADALIVQDLGLASVLRKYLPDLPLHASTQCTITGAGGVQALAKLGFSRVILARELSLEEIGRAAGESPVPVEVFVHGALCVSASGQCLMSSMIGCRSGNRGLCAQPCRLPYSLGGRHGYLLSPKDLCALAWLPGLVATGAAALKIEGRMKSPEYVATVTAIYRKYLDLCAQGVPYRVAAADLEELRLSFDRGGFTAGYLKGRPGSDFIARERPSPPDEARRNAVRALEARAKASYTGAPRRKTLINASFVASVGESLHFEVWDSEGHRAAAESPLPAEEARTLPLSREAAIGQLLKAGGTPFEIAECATKVDGHASARLSDLNALRRDALAALEGMRATRYPARRAGLIEASPPGPPAQPVQAGFSVYLYRWRDDLESLLHLADRVYVPFEAIIEGSVRFSSRPRELIALLPAVTNGTLDGLISRHAPDLKRLGLDGVLIGNAGQLELLKDCGLPLYGDSSLNAFNSWSLEAYALMGLRGVALSQELTMAQIAVLSGCGIEKEAAVYGRQPLMISAYCPVGAETAETQGGGPCGMCGKGTQYELTDRTGARFPLVCGPAGCRCTVLNSDALFVPSLAVRLAKAGVSMLRLYIHDETPEEVERLLALFREATHGGAPAATLGRGFTKGHYFRGV
jgi:U32 family peptidase